MIVVDTSVWVDFFRGVADRRTSLLRALVVDGEAVVGDLILCEILQGLPSEAEAARVAERLDLLPMVGMVGPKIALEAARNYRILRRKGITVRRTYPDRDLLHRLRLSPSAQRSGFPADGRAPGPPGGMRARVLSSGAIAAAAEPDP